MYSKRLTVKRSHPPKEFVLSDRGTNTQHLWVLLLIIDFSRKLCSLVIITSFTSFKTFCADRSAWNKKTWNIDIEIINCTGRKKRDQKQREKNTLGTFIHLSGSSSYAVIHMRVRLLSSWWPMKPWKTIFKYKPYLSHDVRACSQSLMNVRSGMQKLGFR
jgi:hypothetical protein